MRAFFAFSMSSQLVLANELNENTKAIKVVIIYLNINPPILIINITIILIGFIDRSRQYNNNVQIIYYKILNLCYLHYFGSENWTIMGYQMKMM